MYLTGYVPGKVHIELDGRTGAGAVGRCRPVDVGEIRVRVEAGSPHCVRAQAVHGPGRTFRRPGPVTVYCTVKVTSIPVVPPVRTGVTNCWQSTFSGSLVVVQNVPSAITT